MSFLAQSGHQARGWGKLLAPQHHPLSHRGLKNLAGLNSYIRHLCEVSKVRLDEHKPSCWNRWSEILLLITGTLYHCHG